ncbi:hypothetical protein, partial [Burkholderia vietnamiensis]|uniref:hypothetical protein n=1 Tax=Burkholderia vietnamiensis TaxID=60552 RepID=UPI00265277C8
MSCATPILPSGPLGHVPEMTGHVAEIAGHDPETAGHVRPKYALPHDPTLVDQKLAFDPRRIKAVVFGYRVEPHKLAELQLILRGRGVPLYMAYGGVPHRALKLHALGAS